MIVGPSGENIYPEDIESVINTNRFVQESIVTEQDGHLIALIHFDTDAIVKHYEELKLRLARNAELLGQKKGGDQKGDQGVCQLQGQPLLTHQRRDRKRRGVREDPHQKDPPLPLRKARQEDQDSGKK